MKRMFKTHSCLLSALLVAGMAAASLSGYEGPVMKVSAGETAATTNTDSSEVETSAEAETEVTIGQGNFDLEDGEYTGTGTGFAGDIKVEVIIKDKTITDITVVSEFDDDAFFSRAKAGVIAAILQRQSMDVDTVSGATYSSRGIISAVKNALTGEKDRNSTAASGNTASSGASASAGTVPESGSYKDGIYTGSGTGFKGAVKVQVTISAGKIHKIEVLESSDDAAYFDRASALLNTIVSAQSTNVDVVSGASYSSTGIITAVRNALAKAAVSSSTDDDESNSESEESGSEIIKGLVDLPDGIYYGTAEGFNGDVTVAIVIQDKTMVNVVVTENEDDEAFFSRAKGVIANILKKQSPEDVDVVSGATYSSKGILNAVREALKKANTPDTPETSEPETSEPDTSEPETSEPQPPGTVQAVYKDGEYIASVTCTPDEDGDFEAYDLRVTVVVKDGLITEIRDVSGSGSAYVSSNDSYIKKAVNGTSKYVGIAAQMTGKAELPESIDAVSRATCSSNAIAEAVRVALSQAKINE